MCVYAAASNKLKIRSIDITNAYFQGEEQDRLMLFKQPKGGLPDMDPEELIECFKKFGKVVGFPNILRWKDYDVLRKTNGKIFAQSLLMLAPLMLALVACQPQVRFKSLALQQAMLSVMKEAEKDGANFQVRMHHLPFRQGFVSGGGRQGNQTEKKTEFRRLGPRLHA